MTIIFWINFFSLFLFVSIRSLASQKQKYYWQALMTSLLLVLNDFIQNLFTTKSSKCKSAFLCKWASRPHIETGIHSHINTSASEVTAVWCYINQFIIIIIIIIIIITCSSRGRQTVITNRRRLSCDTMQMWTNRQKLCKLYARKFASMNFTQNFFTTTLGTLKLNFTLTLFKQKAKA